MRKVVIMTISILAMLALAAGIWFMFHKTNLEFEKIGEFETEWSYRLENGKPYDPMGWLWYTIPSNCGTQEIRPYVDEYGIDLDTKKYTYIVTHGYELENISIANWYSEKEEDGSRMYYGHVVVTTDCAPNVINLYRTDKIRVVQDDVDREKLSDVTIKNIGQQK